MQSKGSNFSNLDKHIVVVENHEGNFFEDSWATVVKNKMSSKLKSVPVHKTVLNKKGQGCIFFPSEKEKHKAIEVLKSDFNPFNINVPILVHRQFMTEMQMSQFWYIPF